MLVLACREISTFGVWEGVGDGFYLKNKILIPGTPVGKCWCSISIARL